MNLTFFLGAGFSAAFDHPVMDTFLGFADASPRLSKEDRILLGQLVLEARRANSFLESSPTNLEDILSFSEMGERLQLTDTEENRYSRLRFIVQKIYTTIPAEKEYWPRYNAITKLIGSEPREFKGVLSFVTTNYDLNIESACYRLGVPVDPGFEIRQVDGGSAQSVGRLYRTGGIPLFKLHGSVNWYSVDEDPGIAVEDQVVSVLGPRGEEGFPSLPRPCAGNYTPPDVPVIVPPSFLKPDLPPALKAVWRGAAKVLSTANVLVFVGYSFPPSDTEMMFFLARALSENAGIRAVYIVDPKANEITSRLRSVGSKIGSHFRDLIRPINYGWAEPGINLSFPP